MAYSDVYRRSLDDPEGFWARGRAGHRLVREPKQILDDSRPPFTRWFVGGELNTCHNALDRHVDGGRADQLALDLRLAGHRHASRRSRIASCATRSRRSPAC